LRVHMHWVDVVAEELMKKGNRHAVASGTSISGQIHIGNAGDVIMADGVCRAIRERGGEAKLIWIADDSDPLRKIPKQLPPEFDSYLGKPCSSLPCPEGHKHNFIAHFVEPFIAALAKLGVCPEVKSGTEMYRNGEYEPMAKMALEKGAEIRALLKRISGADKAPDWLPFDPICEKCGKIATTHADKYENGLVHYKCIGGVAGKSRIEGCGHEGLSDFRHGKLAWRVEWAARWRILGITCEPFGKEHAAAGGSYDTSKVIVKEIFNYDPPYPVTYEHILVGGKKMSKSLGNIVSLDDFLEVAPPELMRFFFFRTKATKHKDFDVSKNLLHLVEDFEHVERVFYGIDKPSPHEDEKELRRAYELSAVEKPRQRFFQVPYSHLITIAQIKPTYDGVKEILERNGQLKDLTPEWEENLKIKVQSVRNWVKDYAPDEFVFAIQETMPKVELDDKEKELLRKLSVSLAEGDWVAEKLHSTIHETGKALGLDAAKTFGAVYKVVLARQRGPRMGYFLQSLKKDWVLSRLREEA